MVSSVGRGPHFLTLKETLRTMGLGGNQAAAPQTGRQGEPAPEKAREGGHQTRAHCSLPWANAQSQSPPPGTLCWLGWPLPRHNRARGQEKGRGQVANLLLKMRTSHAKGLVQYPAVFLTPASGRRRPWRKQQWLQWLGPCHPSGRPGSSSRCWLLLEPTAGIRKTKQ